MQVVHSKLREVVKDKPKKQIPYYKDPEVLQELVKRIRIEENAKIRARQNKQQ